MTKSHERHTYRLTWPEENQFHIGLCTELPSLSWLDSSPEKAVAGIRKLAKDRLNDMAKNKEQAPEPIALKNYSGKFVGRITPESHRILAIQAAESGISINRLVSSKLN